MRSCVFVFGVWGWCGVFRFGLAVFVLGCVGWVWFPSVRGVAEFLVEEVRLGRLPRGVAERLLGLARAVGEFESVFFGDGDGDAVCLGYYVLRWGGSYRVYVVVAYHSSEPFIEAIDIEEWVSVKRVKRLARQSRV